MLTHRDAGKDGYFLLMISPKDDWSDQEYTAKDVVFVLDTSGSMAEAGKMEKARAALLYGIRILRPQDRFNVVSFAGEERLMETRMIPADDQGRKRGETFVQSLGPSAVRIQPSLLVGMRQFEAISSQNVIFMTDGLPTVGETNPHDVENARAARIAGVRLYFRRWYDVNTHCSTNCR